jgi:hypothetical protein
MYFTGCLEIAAVRSKQKNSVRTLSFDEAIGQKGKLRAGPETPRGAVLVALSKSTQSPSPE